MDKLRRTAPLVITTSDGEAPTAAKLNAISNQLRISTNILEKAVGDLWNQSGDSLLVNYPLQISNLARIVGETKFTNPYLYPVDEDFIYVDNIGTKYENNNEFYLQFKPKTLASITINDDGGALTTRRDNKYEVDASGDYWVELATGRVICFDEIDSDAEVQYTVDSSAWNTRDYTFPSVIPDPRQVDFTGCRVSQTGDNYYLHLPPRIPLTTDFDGGALDGFSLPDRYPPSGDFSDNYDTAVQAESSKHLWQDPTVDALEDNFYRYSLPKEIKDNLSSMVLDDALPTGFLYLWDRGSGTVVADIVFRKTENDWVFRIESATIDFSSKASASETEVAYSDTAYSVIACGSPLSRNMWTLSNALMNHTHGNEGEFSSLVEHSKLTGLNPPVSSYSSHSGRYPTDVPAWAPSRWVSDDHISLLSRVGSQGTSGGRHRDVNDNAMLGDLLLASDTSSGGSFLNVIADSNKLRFGSVTSGPSIFFDLSEGGLVSVSETTSHHGFIGKSTSGYGLYGVSLSNHGLVAQSDTTSPSKSSLRLVPQDTAPSSPEEGDVYCNSTDHHFYGYNGSSWIQLDN
jgi:hypothetical protein